MIPEPTRPTWAGWYAYEWWRGRSGDALGADLGSCAHPRATWLMPRPQLAFVSAGAANGGRTRSSRSRAAGSPGHSSWSRPGGTRRAAIRRHTTTASTSSSCPSTGMKLGMTWIGDNVPAGRDRPVTGLIYRHSCVGHCGGVKDVVHQPTSRSGVSRCSRPKGLRGARGRGERLLQAPAAGTTGRGI